MSRIHQPPHQRWWAGTVLLLLVATLLTFQMKICFHAATHGMTESIWEMGEVHRILEQLQSAAALPPSRPGTEAAAADEDPNDRTMGLSQKQTFNFSTDLPDCHAVSVSADLYVPIFVMTRDRVQSLRETLESYEQTIATPYDIIILDHNSTYPPMLEYLESLQRDHNITVHALRNETWNMACVEAADYIGDYLRAHPDVKYYVLTDPDIALVRTSPDILLYYAALLEACPKVRVVGPQLQISDLPEHYGRKKRGKSVYDVQRKFWEGSVPKMATWRGLGYHLTENGIDSTFALRRRTQRFFRQRCPCIRTYAPYAAVHLDWYYNTTDLPPDKQYYVQHAAPHVNNW